MWLQSHKYEYIFVKRTIIVVETAITKASRAADRNNKQAIIQNCSLFTGCISEIK